MTRYEARVTRLRSFKWEWAVDSVDDGKVTSTQYGTTPFKGIAYQTAYVVRDHRSLDALLEATP